MGGGSSKQSLSKLQISASITFQERIKNYNYALHGPYYEYVEWCRGQFELDCIPRYTSQGNKYNSYIER
jgi:hypothetical protein